MSSEKHSPTTVGQIVTSVKRGVSSLYIKDGNTEMRVIKARDIDENGNLKFDSVNVEMVKVNERVLENILETGDILISTRGSSFKSIIIPKEADGYLFAANFSALTVNKEVILPEVLVWYLQSEMITKYLLSKSTGEIIRSIGADDILSLKINVPTMKRQKELVGFLSKQDEFRKIIREQEMLLAKMSEEMLMEHLWAGE